MKKNKIVIIGASHGGHQLLLDLLSQYGNEVDITVLENSNYVSFMSCGMELFLENKTTGIDNVRNFRKSDFKQNNVHILNNTEVKSINPKKKMVIIFNNGKLLNCEYDKLIITSGVIPKMLNIPGKNLNNIYGMRGFDSAHEFKDKINDRSIKNIVVIGTGYIGIEASEIFAKAGKKVTLIGRTSNVVEKYLDKDLSKIISTELDNNNIIVKNNTEAIEFTGEKSVKAVKTEKELIPADMVIEAIGISPNTEYLKNVINVDKQGFINTNEYFQTNVPDVYAIGDAVKVYSIPANKKLSIALASTTRREAKYVANHLYEKIPSDPFVGIVGSSALKVFDYYFATSGLSAFNAKRLGITVKTVIYEDYLQPSFISKEQGNEKAYVKIVFNPNNHQILGSSILSKKDITFAGNIFSLAIQNKLTVDDLAIADFFFQPGFDRQWNIINLAAQSILNSEKLTF